MLTLTLQTSDRNNAVAVFKAGECLFKTDYEDFIAHHFSPANEKSAQAPPGGSTLLLPMVQFCLKQTKVTAADLGLIAVTQGPGMFTPLRVGVVAAKTMAFVNNVPLVGVDVLEALALATTKRRDLKPGQIVESVVNAQRKQIFTGRFEVSTDQRVEKQVESQLVLAEKWAQEISAPKVLTGPGLKIVPESQRMRLSEHEDIVIESDELCNCDVAAVADIAGQRFSNGDVDDPWSLSPIYFRPSAAEEVRAAKSASSK